tara:strand:+ start:214 stop:1548 length:1335 start_codon:yes stop_codon:yes gene_type:complete
MTSIEKASKKKAPNLVKGNNIGDGTDPKPSFFKKIQNYIDNPIVDSELEKALNDIIIANEDSEEEEEEADEEADEEEVVKEEGEKSRTDDNTRHIGIRKKKGGGAKDLVHEKIMIAQEIAEKLYHTFQEKENKTEELNLYGKIDDLLIEGAEEHKNKQTLEHFENLKKNDEGHKNNAVNSILKTLVKAIGKDSPGAEKARADLQRLLKEYPNQVPTALIGIVREKLKKNGLGIILAIQLSATMIGLLLSIIPIPGLAVIGEAVAIAANMGTDLLVAVGPEQIIDLLKNGSQKALEAFTKGMVPIIEGVSGAFCCNSSGDKKNMEKFGKIMEHLIELANIDDNKEEAKTKIEAYIKEIQGVMSKPVPGVDMAALDKLIKKYPPPKADEKGEPNIEQFAVKGGGKRRKTRKKRKRKRRKRKTRRRRRKRRKRRKTNKYRKRFTRRY